MNVERTTPWAAAASAAAFIAAAYPVTGWAPMLAIPIFTVALSALQALGARPSALRQIAGNGGGEPAGLRCLPERDPGTVFARLDLAFSFVLGSAALLFHLAPGADSAPLIELFIVLFSVCRTVAAAAHATMAESRIPPGVRVFATVLLGYLALTFHMVHANRLEGDEPYYVLIAHSLLEDHDANLKNNYEQKDSLRFHDTAIRPQPGDPREGAHSRHPATFPVFLLPGYALMGRMGAMMTMNLLCALLALLVYDVGKNLCGSPRAAMTGAFVTALTCPMMLYSTEILPEVPAAILALFLLRELLRPGGGRLLPVMAGAAVLMALKTRFALVGVPLVLTATLLHRHGRRVVAWTAVAVTAAAVLMFAWNVATYGRLLQMHTVDELIPRPLALFRGAGGLLFDHAFGLLWVSPLFAFIALGAGVLMARNRRALALLAGGSLPYLFLLAQRPNWYGEWGPPPRYLLIAVMFLSPLLAAALSVPLSRWAAFLWTAGFVWAAVPCVIWLLEPGLCLSLADGTGQLANRFAAAVDADVVRFLPSFLRPTAWSWTFAAAGTAVLAALFVEGRRRGSSSPRPGLAGDDPPISARDGFRAFRPEAVPVCCVACTLLAGVLAAAAHRVPTAVWELEHRNVHHTAGKMVPGLWTMNRFFYQHNGWELPPGASSTSRILLKPGTWSVSILVRSAEEGREADGVLRIGNEVLRFRVNDIVWQHCDFQLTLATSAHEGAVVNLSPDASLIVDRVTFRRLPP